MSAIKAADTGYTGEDPVFVRIAEDLRKSNCSVIPNALPEALALAVFEQLQLGDTALFQLAGVGRDSAHTLNQFVRQDQILWIEGQTNAEQRWLEWTECMRLYLNRELFLGLQSFESHFAHYSPGGFYRKHLDAFKTGALLPRTNRILSLVAYFNPGWLPGDGGELVIYDESGKEVLLKVTPAFATLVVFLSAGVPHEVLPPKRHRYSIAGWFCSGSAAPVLLATNR